MAKFVLFVGLVGVFLSGPAAAVPIDWGMESASQQVLRVTLYADDGFSQASSSVDVLGVNGFNSRITGDLSGIISPVLTLDSIEYSFDNLSLDFDIGASHIPVSLSLGGSVGWSGIVGASAILGTTDSFSSPSSLSSQQLNFSGSLGTPFGLLPFDVSGALTRILLYAGIRSLNNGQASGPGFPVVSGFSPNYTFTDLTHASLQSHSDSSTYLLGAAGAGFKQSIGSVGGVAWSVGVNPAYQNAVYTPEPSTALLLGIGLAGLAARKRV